MTFLRFSILGLVLFNTGCKNVVGPLEAQRPYRYDDPRLTIPEQEKIGRQFLTLDNTYLSGPRSGFAQPIDDVGR